MHRAAAREWQHLRRNMPVVRPHHHARAGRFMREDPLNVLGHRAIAHRGIEAFPDSGSACRISSALCRASSHAASCVAYASMRWIKSAALPSMSGSASGMCSVSHGFNT